MSAFAKHNIKHLSPSSLNLWTRNPWLWSLQYLGGFKDAGPAMWWGSAVEDGASTLLLGRSWEHALSAANIKFEQEAAGEITDEIDVYRKLIEPALKQAQRAYEVPPGKLIGAQINVTHHIDDVAIPVVGRLDYLFEGVLDDLKTTKAIPRQGPKLPHVRQVALYSKAKGVPARIVYVSKSDRLIYNISEDDVEAAYAELREAALRLEAFLSRIDGVADALHILPIDRDAFGVNERALEAHKALMGAMQ